MKLAKLTTYSCLLYALTVSTACKKEEDKGAPSTTAPVGSSGSDSTPRVEPTSEQDHITVLAHHNPAKPTDPVRIDFKKFKVVSASFDPQKIEGGKAVVEIDLSSFTTDSDERDEHLKSPAYLDVLKFATANITIDNVKAKSGSSYTADATVVAHGITKTYPVDFEVLSHTDSDIRIKGTHSFERLDFGVGTDPGKNAEEQVGTDLKIEMVLRLPKS